MQCGESRRTCSPFPSYMLIQRGCHKLHKINSVQSVGPGWKCDSISQRAHFYTDNKTRQVRIVKEIGLNSSFIFGKECNMRRFCCITDKTGRFDCSATFSVQRRIFMQLIFKIVGLDFKQSSTACLLA